MKSARMDRRVTFSRRAILSETERGDFADYLTVWAQYTRLSGRESLQAGRVVNVEDGTLRIRDSEAAREISSADRVSIGGRDHAIKAVALPERRGGYITISVSSSLGD